jgi:hypothetical protein
MNCNVLVFYKIIFSNKIGFILETSIFLYKVFRKNSAIPYTDDATPTCFGWLGLLNTNGNISICAVSSKEGLVFVEQNCQKTLPM